ncbi:hypothetical protein TcCL_NonESM10322 [Trypanosoma cruzi]|nr:hypothetical protein TcCL_NonESM10322 [Trypanosoma cruzi]
MHEKRRHRSRFREMLLLMDCAAYVILLGYPTAAIVLLLFNIVFSSGTLCVAIKWNLISHALPKTPLTTSSARLFILFTPLWERMILNYGRTFLHLSLSSHLDPLHYCMAPPRQPISLWRYIVQQLAGSHAHIGPECLATENGIRHLIPFCLETSQSPTRMLVATDSPSRTEALRVVPLAMRDYVTEDSWIMLLFLIQRGHSADFMFSPSHCGIPRNEAADDEAMIARSLPQEDSPIWHMDFFTAVG